MGNKKIKILFIHHGTGIGGASICLKELILSLNDSVDPMVLCLKNSDAVSFFENSGIKTNVLDSFFYRKIYTFWPHIEGTTFSITSIISLPRYVISYILNVLFFSKKTLKDYNFDILYLNTTFLTDWAFIGKRCYAKVIMHVREPLGKGFLGLRRFFFRKVINQNVQHIIAISNDNAGRIGLPLKTTVIYDPMRKAIFSKQINITENNKYFLYLGGLQMIKGFYVLVKALPYLNKNVKIFIAGSLDNNFRSGIVGKIKKQYEKYWKKKLRNSDAIIELGLIDNVYDYLNASNFLLFPSVIPHFAGPIMEAYKIGKPVIASDVSGMDEIVNSKTGLFFSNKNAKNLAKTINDCANLSDFEYLKFEKDCLNMYNTIYDSNLKVDYVIQKVLSNNKI